MINKGAEAALTHERLLEVVNYDAEKGVFTPRSRRTGKRMEILGSRNSKGYLMICIDYRPYRAHRLAWFYVYGTWPENYLDHRDLDKGNNRINNLREATRSTNAANMPVASNNTSGFKGVFSAKNKWVAQIGLNGKRIRLGTYSTPEEAHAAYMSAANRIYGEFARAS